MYLKNKWCRRIVQLIGVSDYVRVWYLYPVVITLTFCMLVGYCKWTLGIIHVIVIVILPFLSCHDHACRCPKRARLINFMLALLFNCLFVTLNDLYNASLKTISEYHIQKKIFIYLETWFICVVNDICYITYFLDKILVGLNAILKYN